MRYLLTLLVFLLMVPTAAFATISPCTNDRLKFCRGVNATLEDVRACLLQHQDELSEACKARLGETGRGKTPTTTPGATTVFPQRGHE